MTKPFPRARRLARRVLNLRYRGARYTDPICGRSFRAFAPGPRRRPQAYCPACGSAERHRVLWLYLEREVGLAAPRRVLHVAPELGIAERLRQQPGVSYVSVDLHPGRAMVRADLTALPFGDESFDLVLCNHVLEHIPDDRAAMRELRRVLAPGGLLVCQHPVDADRATTFEDASITDPEDRERAFFQHDHVRIYGRDFAERLAGAPFGEVRATKYQRALTEDEIETFRLRQLPSAIPDRDIEYDVIYTARP
jgi:SAM-dependent methyltransferase